VTGPAQAVGAFPERWVEEYQTRTPTAELRLGTHYLALKPGSLSLTDGATTDAATGLRSIRLHVEIPIAPADLVGQDLQIRLHFGNRPLWDHLAFWASGKLAAFRDAQIVDRETRIEQSN
jgi:putative peptide zinc metalloprotease protein